MMLSVARRTPRWLAVVNGGWPGGRFSSASAVVRRARGAVVSRGRVSRAVKTQGHKHNV